MTAASEKSNRSDEIIENLDPLLTVDDAAIYLRLTRDTIRTMARSGKLPAIKLGRSWRFKKSQLMKLIQEENSI